MDRNRRWWMALLCAGLAAMWTGCRPAQEQSPPEAAGPKATSRQPAATPESGGKTAGPAPDTGHGTTTPGGAGPETGPPETPAAPGIPKVVLTAEQEATCLVRVGDPMPDGELLDADGRAHQLRDLYGPKLTVVFFWTAGDSDTSRMLAGDALMRLSRYVAERFAGQGVQVIGVDEGDTPETMVSLVQESGAKFPSYQDPQAALFAKVATEKLPRVYLIDAGGKILWFDLVFSRTTRRDLVQAILAELAKPGS